MSITAAAAAFFQIIFEGVVVLSNTLNCFNCGIAQFCTAEVGVQDNAGCIDDRTQAHGCFFGDTADDFLTDGFFLQTRFFSGKNLLTQSVDYFTHRFGQNGVLAGEGGKRRMTQKLVYFWDFSEKLRINAHRVHTFQKCFWLIRFSHKRICRVLYFIKQI